MITVPITRQQGEDVQNYFFPYFKMLKATNFKNIAHLHLQHGEVLTAITINCVIDELMLIVNKKMINTAGHKINLKFSDAQAVIFYKLMLQFPLNADQVHMQQLTRYIIDVLDKELIKYQIYNTGKAMQQHGLQA